MRITIPGILASVLIFTLAAAFVRLGFWQLDRLEQRRARNAALLARIEAPPLDITPALHDTAGLQYRHALAAGTFDGPRSIVLPGHSFRGVPGVHLLTPLKLDATSAVLVNRGWIPSADAATVDTSFFRERSSARVSGIVMPFPGAETPASSGPSSGDTFRRVWFALDASALRRQFPYRLLDIELQELPDGGAAGYPRSLPRPVLDEGPHLGYALQWFAFALVAVGGWIAMILHGRAEAERRDLPATD